VAAEKVRPAGGPALFRLFHQGEDVLFEFVRLAVGGVQGYINRIAVGHSVDMLGDGNRPEDHVFDGQAGGKGRPSGRDLDDSVAFAFGQSFEDGIGGG
jgi:hypothetical protein